MIRFRWSVSSLFSFYHPTIDRYGQGVPTSQVLFQAISRIEGSESFDYPLGQIFMVVFSPRTEASWFMRPVSMTMAAGTFLPAIPGRANRQYRHYGAIEGECLM